MRVETFKKLTLIDILVVILLIIILLQRCGGTTSILDSPKIIRDTVWVQPPLAPPFAGSWESKILKVCVTKG